MQVLAALIAQVHQHLFTTDSHSVPLHETSRLGSFFWILCLPENRDIWLFILCMINVSILVSDFFYNTNHCNFDMCQNVTTMASFRVGNCYYLQITLIQVIYSDKEGQCTYQKTTVVQPIHYWRNRSSFQCFFYCNILFCSAQWPFIINL